MSRRSPLAAGLTLLAALAGAEPAAALAAEPADLPGLERAWHGCVREAFDRQPAHRSRPGRERGALDACKPQEDAYVAALMAARPIDANRPALAWARTWMAYVVDPLRDRIAALHR
ncbi:hypothetical protein [Methylobacterium sp. yr668]|uniref:hypothetical protein n=1 Tax=Methylobacterium sp. yr668 TaxID=1761801 RepID=UPI0008E6789A|nr:hypothetical protein [Methylobacterium sp. yr668]SFT13488.1 hypothetical protein SAMN04487845_11839 [Methylobacterium sp. yr668]